jgi:hypothetical protein
MLDNIFTVGEAGAGWSCNHPEDLIGVKEGRGVRNLMAAFFATAFW